MKDEGRLSSRDSPGEAEEVDESLQSGILGVDPGRKKGHWWKNW